MQTSLHDPTPLAKIAEEKEQIKNVFVARLFYEKYDNFLQVESGHHIDHCFIFYFSKFRSGSYSRTAN
jgi:hypothetical protein